MAARDRRAPSSGLTRAGTGLMAGRQTDPWGIGQGISDAVGYTGSAVGSIGRRLEDSGTLLLGLLVMAAGGGILLWLYLHQTSSGAGIRRAGRQTARAARRTAEMAAVLVPK